MVAHEEEHHYIDWVDGHVTDHLTWGQFLPGQRPHGQLQQLLIH